MQCHSCGHTVEPDARFCSACGARVRVNCWSCNALIDQAASHCPQCGANQAASQAGSGGSPSNVGIVAEKPAEPEPTASEGEWRQVTILFCDVVGSTKLTEQVDVEDLHELWLTFQHASASVVERYGGHIAKFLGDGFVAYFGYPHAFEDAPHRGALAGLGVLARIGQLNDGEWGRLGIKVRVRQGLHTGVVVAGEMGAGSTRERASIVGMAPNIAARLEAFAQPDTIAVSIDTQRLIGEQFSFEPLGRHELAGVDEPVEIFQLLGKKTAPTTIGMAGQESENLIGRVKEVSMLLDAWDSVRQDSRPMIARVVGEPGIGKTAVLGAFLQRAAADPDQLVVLACTNIDRNSAFGPVVTMFQREFGFSLDGEVDEAAERIEEWLTERGLNDERAIGSIVGLLLADRAETTRSNADAREVRREIFAALSAYFSTKKAPLLLVLEDAHWADPSTVELVDWICRRTEQWSGLLLEVSRPESSHPWKRLANITIHMVGLTPEGCENLILQVTDGKEMERRVLDHIVARSDGVPLFVEELTRWVLASGKLIERGGRLRMVGDVASLNVPASLADSLTERLDRLGSGKALAQAAAVPGRDFTFDELSAVADEKGDQLRRSLDQLILAGFLAEIEAPTEAIHQFQHALYRLVAYDSMLRGRRRLLHQRFVEWIDSHPERRAAMRPEILASHCDRAGLQDRAVTLWIEAGERASDASAMIEAERHLTKALDILSDLEQSDDNRTLALKTNVLLGPVLMMNKGTGAAETREVYDRALSLCEGLPQTQWHFPAYWGWWRISDNFKLMRQRAEQLLTVVDDMQEEEYSLEAHHCSWVNSFMVGDHKACIEHVDDGMAIYDGGTFDSLGTLYGGHDPKVCGLGEKALSTWLCGKPDTASDLVEEALDWGEKTNHLGSLLHALDIAIMLRHYLRDTKATRALADRLDWLGRKHELDDYRVKGQIFEGWCLVAEGSAKEGAKQITEALETIRRTVTQEDYPVYFSMHAQAQTALGNVEEAQSILDEGLGLSEKYGMAYWTPELIRQSAETQIAAGSGDPVAIDALLDCAATTARGQGALSLELRVAVCRARWRLGDDPSAIAGLRAVFGQFNEGFKTPDLLDAQALLDAHGTGG